MKLQNPRVVYGRHDLYFVLEKLKKVWALVQIQRDGFCCKDVIILVSYLKNCRVLAFSQKREHFIFFVRLRRNQKVVFFHFFDY